MDDFEFMLMDRIAKIQAINEQYDLEHNAYISFSGGKDSTILHYLIDLALPNNTIPRVFSNTGIEYKFIREFVEGLAATDPRIYIINAGVNLKKMWETEGYPFKSKMHSHIVGMFQKGYQNKSLMEYINGTRINEKGKEVKPFNICPSILKYQFEDNFKIKIGEKCCSRLKKQPMKNYANKNKKTIYITGMRSEEGGRRQQINCTAFKNNELKAFHPLLVISEEWEDEFVKRYNIKLCKLYYPPYNFTRTGCKGCPFALNLQEDLDAMEDLLPNEKKQCEIMFKPVYDEYRRLGYRLRKNGTGRQISLFDFIIDDTQCNQK